MRALGTRETREHLGIRGRERVAAGLLATSAAALAVLLGATLAAVPAWREAAVPPGQLDGERPAVRAARLEPGGSARSTADGEVRRAVPRESGGGGVLGSVVSCVTTGAGAPVAGARVLLLRGVHELRAARSDAAGEARFGALPPGAYWLRLDPHGSPPGLLAAERVPVLVARGGVHTVEVRGERAATVEGYVRDPAGSPVPGALVRLQGASPGSALRSAAARADERGHYELGLLRPGRWRAQVVPPPASLAGGLAPPWPSEHEVAGGAVHALDLWLEPAGPAIAGRLVDEDGAPRAGLVVLGAPGAGAGQASAGAAWSLTLARTLSGADGRFLLAGLPAGPVALRVAARSGPFAGAGVGPGVGESKGGARAGAPDPVLPAAPLVDLPRARGTRGTGTVDVGTLVVRDRR